MNRQRVKKYLSSWAFKGVLLLALAYRLHAAFQVPQVSTDAFRNLGYASHAMENNFNIYNTIGVDYEDESWARFNVWNGLPYQYPPVTLMFFYFFSAFGMGIFWVKIVLTAIELGCTYYFYKRVSKASAILFFCAPVSLWYTSHEGQFESLQTLFIILNIVAVNNGQWRKAGLFFALSAQVKLWGILMAPWMLYRIWQERRAGPAGAITRDVSLGVALGFIPFIGFYLRTPDLLFISLRIASEQSVSYNPFAWNFLDASRFGWNPSWLVYWNATFTLLPLLILAVSAVREKGGGLVSFLPLGSFLGLLKSLNWGQFWYTMVGPGYLFCLEKRKTLVILLLALHFAQCARSMALIADYQFGHQEDPRNRSLMAACMFKCDVRSPVAQAANESIREAKSGAVSAVIFRRVINKTAVPSAQLPSLATAELVLRKYG